MDIEIRNPVLLPDGKIDCEVNHPHYGWIPFTANAEDVEEHGRAIHAIAMEMGPAEYVPPPPQPEPVPRAISFAQLLIGLVSEGWITEAEGRAWRDRVSLPKAVQDLIATLPERQRFAAETRALAPFEVRRSDDLVAGLAAAAGKSPEVVDDFFRAYSKV